MALWEKIATIDSTAHHLVDWDALRLAEKCAKVSTQSDRYNGITATIYRDHHDKTRRLAFCKITNRMRQKIRRHHTCVPITKRRRHMGKTTESPSYIWGT